MLPVSSSLGERTHTHTFSHSFQTQQGALGGRNMSWPSRERRTQRNVHHCSPHETDSPSASACGRACEQEPAWARLDRTLACSDITGVWKCVGACALVERCVCHVSASAATSLSKANTFSILPSQTVMSQSEWRRKGGKWEGSRKIAAEKRSLTIHRAPLVFYKSTTNSTSS